MIIFIALIIALLISTLINRYNKKRHKTWIIIDTLVIAISILMIYYFIFNT